jgi:hypothetical protein
VSEVHCFTSATLGYLDRVRVLGETLRRHQPRWTFSLCLCDREPPGFSLRPGREPFDGVVRIDELGIERLRPWIFEHDVVELCTAVKGPMLCRLLDEGASRVVYLDPDIAVLGDLAQIETLLSKHDVLLTPHTLQPEEERNAVLDNEIGSLKHGAYNLGFVAVANTGGGRAFARWWRERLLAFCFDDIPGGLFTDQRWCDLAPALFPGVHILRDPGYNVASWNLSHRPVSIERDGRILAAGVPLRFFHFTKVPGIGERMIERYAGGSLAVHEILAWYRARLAANGAAGVPDGWWAYGCYADGATIPAAHRLAYRRCRPLRERFPDPFAAGCEPMARAVAWHCRDPAPSPAEAS